MVRSILAVVAGFAAASVVMVIVETVNGMVLYPELSASFEGVDDPEERRRIIAGAPVGALVVVLAGWWLGGLAGGCVTTRLSPQRRWPAIALGLLLTLAGVANNTLLPPPAWFWIATFVVLPLGTFVGTRLAGRPSAGSE